MAKKLSNKQIIDKLRIDEHYYGEFGRQWLSNSDIQNLQPSSFKQFGKVEPDNENFIKGRYFHQLILEPKKAKDFPIFSDTKTRGVKYDTFIQENNITGAVLEHEALLMEQLRDEILNVKGLEGAKKQVADLITHKDAEYEVPVVGEIFGHPFKAKADIISQGIIIDLKTTTAKTIEDFVRLGKQNYYYHTQSFIYQTLFNKPMTFIAIDKARKEYGNTGEFYHEIYVCPTSEETVLQGKQKVEQAVQIYENYHGKDKKEDIRNVIYNLNF
ncbi:MAG: PD-(D/E)XK nuclease-like domain-containing protein [Cyanophyceae cyanobacterium]